VPTWNWKNTETSTMSTTQGLFTTCGHFEGVGMVLPQYRRSTCGAWRRVRLHLVSQPGVGRSRPARRFQSESWSSWQSRGCLAWAPGQRRDALGGFAAPVSPRVTDSVTPVTQDLLLFFSPTAGTVRVYIK
jgi:hypothetical protein